MKISSLMLVFLPVLLWAQQETIPDDQSNMSSLTAKDFAKLISVGWNVGNSLEAVLIQNGDTTIQETAWGNPTITQQLIDSVNAAGFNAIRLPVGWSVFSNKSTWTIKKEWLDRVEEVVNYALKRNMFVIMNEHWDGGWLQPTNSAKDQANKRLAAIWKQVAIRFRDYGDHLLFAGTNEVMKDGDYGTPSQELLIAQSSYLQTFVNTVRATGGRNAYRYLVVQAFNTNIDHAVNFFQLPADKKDNRLMLEVHFYDPWEFTIDGNNTTITQWGKNGAPAKKATWDSDESHIDAMFTKMKSNFIDKGIPVILGEYAAMLKNNSDNPPFRLDWNKYVTEAAIKAEMIPFYWDPGFVTTGSSGLFDRNTGKPVHTDVIKVIVEAAPRVAITPVHKKQRLKTNNLVQVNNQLISNERTAILLYNPNGRLVRTSTFNGKNTVISLNGLQSGLYIANSGSYRISIMVR